MAYTDVMMEDAIFPWLASDCMADQEEYTEEGFERDVDECENCGAELHPDDGCNYCQDCQADAEFYRSY